MHWLSSKYRFMVSDQREDRGQVNLSPPPPKTTLSPILVTYQEFGVVNRQEFGWGQVGSKRITGPPDRTIFFKSAMKQIETVVKGSFSRVLSAGLIVTGSVNQGRALSVEIDIWFTHPILHPWYPSKPLLPVR